MSTRKPKRSLAIALVLMMALSVLTLAPTSPAAAQNTQAFTDAANLGRGVNVAYERPNGQSFRVRRPAAFNAILDDISRRGFDHIRLAVDFNRHSRRVQGKWQVRPAFLRGLRAAVRQANNRDLLVILDMHGKGNNGFHKTPARARPRFVGLWSSIATAFKAERNVYFQLMNEPIGPSLPVARNAAQRARNLKTTNTYSGAVNRYYTQATRAIRAAGANQPILISPIFYNNLFEIPRLRMPTVRQGVRDNRVIIDVHFYDPLCFTHQGADWLAGTLPAYKASCQTTNVTWQSAFADDPFATQAQEKGKEAWMTDAFNNAVKFAAAKNAPVYIGEFGTNDPSYRGNRFRAPRRERLAWTQAVVDNTVNTKQAGQPISFGYWEYEASFGLCNSKRWDTGFLNVLVPRPGGHKPGPCQAND